MKVQLRNYPPVSGIRVPAEEMRGFVRELFERVEMDGADAEFMAQILVNNDLRNAERVVSRTDEVPDDAVHVGTTR